MKSSRIIIPILLFMLLADCSKENELKKSVFIPDSESPELPAYSEWGYNTFGAFYDREIFVSTDAQVPSKVFSSDTAMQLILEGERRYDYYTYYSEMSLTFTLEGFTPEQFGDLVALNDTIIDLDDPRCRVQLFEYSIEIPVKILSGSLYFKRVQNLSVDKRPVEAILSGYFEFQAVIRDEPITVSEGRFDLGIGSDNFYLNK